MSIRMMSAVFAVPVCSTLATGLVQKLGNDWLTLMVGAVGAGATALAAYLLDKSKRSPAIAAEGAGTPLAAPPAKARAGFVSEVALGVSIGSVAYMLTYYLPLILMSGAMAEFTYNIVGELYEDDARTLTMSIIVHTFIAAIPINLMLGALVFGSLTRPLTASLAAGLAAMVTAIVLSIMSGTDGLGQLFGGPALGIAIVTFLAIGVALGLVYFLAAYMRVQLVARLTKTEAING